MCNSPIENLIQLPSPPLSPFNNCDNILNFEPFVCGLGIETKDLKVESSVNSPVELTEEDILRNNYKSMKEDGVQIDNELVPYPYFINKLHSMGKNVINKKTKDALPLRVYETNKDTFEDFWVHPMFLSLQSYQFYKLFEEVKKENEQGIIEIEVPSLKAFPIILYYIYTGDLTKVLNIAKMDESLCKGIMETIQYLNIDMETF